MQPEPKGIKATSCSSKPWHPKLTYGWLRMSDIYGPVISRTEEAALLGQQGIPYSSINPSARQTPYHF